MPTAPSAIDNGTLVAGRATFHVDTQMKRHQEARWCQILFIVVFMSVLSKQNVTSQPQARYQGMLGDFCATEGITFDSATANHLVIDPDFTLPVGMTIVLRLLFDSTNNQRFMDFATPTCDNGLLIEQAGGPTTVRMSLTGCGSTTVPNYW